MKKYIFLIFAFLFTSLSFAQIDNFTFNFQNNIPLIESNDTLELGWAGGINAAQFNTLDVNEDGNEDLIIFDQSIQRFICFLSNDSSYEYGFDYASIFPSNAYGWAFFRDANCDGRKDLYTKDPLGGRIWRNQAGPVSYPNWTSFDDIIQFDTTRNIQISEQDIPAFEDIDGDGDIDLAVFEFFNGGFMDYFQNISIETVGDCSISEYHFATQCWGRFFECPSCGDYNTGYDTNCSNPTNGTQCRVASGAHVGSTSLLIDLDGDNDKDLLLGDIGCNEISYLENLGSNTFAQMDVAQLGWPFNTTKIDFFTFPALFYEDVDFDGEKDILVSPNVTDNQGDLINFSTSTAFYKNNGTTANPNFAYQQQDFLQDRMLDVGDYSHPALYDFDNDGDLDLFIGNRGYEIAGNMTSDLAYYENTGTPTAPSFELVDDDFLSLSNQHVESIRPFFTDLSGDGIDDFCFTWIENDVNSMIKFIPNESTSGGMVVNIDSLKTYPMSFPSLFRNDFPKFYDYDGDGVDDLFLGWSQFGLMRYYRNDGSIENPNFVEVSLDVGKIGSFLSDIQPSFEFSDMDNDGNIDMVFGDRYGRLKIFPNFINQIPLNDTIDFTDNLINNGILGKGPYKLNEYLKVAIGDLNNDSIPDVVLGNKTGGIQILYNESIAGMVEANQLGRLERIKVFPNPGNGEFNIDIAESGSVIIYDLMGRSILNKTVKSGINSMDISFLENGIYILELNSDSGKTGTVKILKQ